MRPVAVLMIAGGLVSVPPSVANAEIVFLEGGKVALAEPEYAYQHPTLRSVVFVTPESRQMAILPPPVTFVPHPMLIWRGSTAMPVYPPPAVASFNQPARPTNQDVTNYTLQRAHGFSQEMYNKDNRIGGTLSNTPYYYGYSYGYNGLGVPYPPPAPASFNQPARPSNRDMNNYNLERAHRFSMDLYKK